MSMTIGEKIEVLTAAKHGGIIQLRPINSNMAWRSCEDALILVWNFKLYDYRLAPKPKLRPIRLDELPNVFWARPKFHYSWHLVTEVEPSFETIFIVSTLPTHGSLHNRLQLKEAAKFPEWQWSADRKTANSFMVEDK